MFHAIPADWIVLAGGGAFILGYLIINQIILRWMVNLGTLLYIWHSSVAIEEPWAAITSSVLMGLANCAGLAKLYYIKSKHAVPKKHADIYPIFSTLPPGDFRALMKFAQRFETEHDEIITKEGVENTHLYYVLSGKMSAEKKAQSFELPARIFVGEVAYMTNNPASATTRLAKGSEVLRWNINELRKNSEKNDRFRLALDALISSDLARKVATAVAPKGYKAPKVSTE